MKTTRPTLKCQNCLLKFRPQISSGMELPKVCSKCKRGVSGATLPVATPDAAGSVRIIRETPADDAVNHPSHYRANGIEVIDVIDAFGCNFNIGNAIKYALRYNRKFPVQPSITDLRKSVWYLNHEIEKMEKAGG